MMYSLQDKQLHEAAWEKDAGGGPERVPPQNPPKEPTAMIERLKDEFGDYSDDPNASNWFWRNND
jgi:hypothetical protein